MKNIFKLSDSFIALMTVPLENAVAECIWEGILAEFLQKNRAEAIAVNIFEYDEEKERRSFGLPSGKRELNRGYNRVL